MSDYEKIRVLLVEDQNSYMYTELLTAINGFEFKVLERGDHAPFVAAEWRPDVIVIDIRLPMLDGADAIKAIRGFDKTTPIIAITAYSDADTISRVMSSGATTIFIKPFSYSKLKKAIYDLYRPTRTTSDAELATSELLFHKHRRLAELRIKQAKYGLSTPVEIITEIQDLEKELSNE